MTGSARVPGFLPSVNGFHFANSWPHQPDITIPCWPRPIHIGDAANGLCGGMVFAVRDFFEEKRLISPTPVNPPLHTPLYDFIVRRLFDSFDIPDGVALFMSWQLPVRNQFKDTVLDEWPRIRTQLGAGTLVPLGLVRTRSYWPSDLGKNHQVLAFGYDEDEASRAILHLYDPNNPDCDEVTLSFSAGSPEARDMTFAVSGTAAAQDSAAFTHGCFVQTYRHVSPPGP